MDFTNNLKEGFLKMKCLMGTNYDQEGQKGFHEILSKHANRQIRKIKDVKRKKMHGKMLRATFKEKR